MIDQAFDNLGLLRHPNHHDAPAPHTGDPRQIRLSTWSSQQLRDIIHAVACTERFVAHPPDQIDFGGFLPAFARLEILTKRGSEYGRAATVNLSTRRILFGETVIGDETSVSIPIRGSQFTVPFLMLHSHPISSSPRDSYHFSSTDICSFLSFPSLQFTVVVAEGLTLVAMRTDTTPRYSDGIKERIIKLRDSTRSARLDGSSRSHGSRFTTEVCSMLNLGLYRIKHSDGSGLAKRVVN